MNTNQRAGALQGIRVLDLSRILGGPLCGQILGDHGADVLKVEPPQGDDTRAWGPPFQDGVSSYYRGLNRNKRLQFLDLSQPEGQQAVLALMEQADVVVENFKIGTMEKWGIGWEQLRERFPRLIWCRVSGFGADGPLGGLPGYDACAQAMCGLMSVNGDADGEATRVGLPVVDMVTGLNAAVGILLALNEREKSGLGQFVDMTLFDCAISLLHPHAANFFYSGKTPQRSGNAHPNIAPYETFETQTGAIFLAVGNNTHFAGLLRVLSAEHLGADPRFVTNAERLKHRDALREALGALLASQDAAVLADKLLRHGVPAAPVLTVPDILSHPHTAHRNMVMHEGDYHAVASPIKLSRTPASLRRLPPKLGEHNEG